MDALGSDAVGVSFTTLAIIFGGLSIGIGFGLQNIASNLIYGN
ncbi:MAG: mechanosensitive ion channel [Candidatus Poribacteria bacterium]|nr:mechanosensitive ion channel [Candidatus Poribacteria bacterium]